MRQLSPPWRWAAAAAVALVLWKVIDLIPLQFSPLIVGHLQAMYRRDLNRFEWWCLAAALAVAVLARRWKRPPCFPHLPGWRAWVLVGVLALAVRAAIVSVLPLPQPAVYDEFSFLLQADTFVRGRLTNSPHPFWMHFETMHTIQQPTYNSMYFPMQGLILALGQVLGHPWIGVWLSCAAMCAALTWMLQAWLPPRWALLGGLIALVRIATFSYWSHSYWGGAHAMIGGCMVIGGLGRLLKTRYPRRRDAMLMALGMVILANGRPYEGVLLCVPVGLLFLWKTAKHPRLLAPFTLVLALGLGALFYYCWSVTGNPFRPPYQVNRDTYGWPTTLAFLPVPEVTHRHFQMHGYYLIEVSQHTYYQSWGRLVVDAMMKAVTLWSFYLGPALTLPLLFLPWIGRGRFRPLLLMLAGGAAGLSLEQTVWPHYASPFAGVLYAVTLQGLRYLWHLRRNWISGAGLAWSLSLILPFAALARVGEVVQLWRVPSAKNVYSWCCLPPASPTWPRPQMIAYLEAMGGQHLVFVQYVPENRFNGEEWVFNTAEIDSQQIVWARELGAARNRALIRYYPGRRVWRLHVEQHQMPVLQELRR